MKNNNFYTYGMIKPDAINHKEEILKMIYEAGLEVPYMEFDNLTDEIIEENYSHCIGKDFYSGMKENLQSGPVLKMLIFDKTGDAVSNYRKVLGATKSSEALPDTIRGRFGNKEVTHKNAAHGSGNEKEANDEIIRFFKGSMQDLLANVRISGMKHQWDLLTPNYTDSDIKIEMELIKAKAKYKKGE